MSVPNVTKKSTLLNGLLSVLFLGAFVGTLSAQSHFVLSKNADFSTDDRVYAREDTLYMKVVAPEIDYTDIDKNEFRLQPDSGGNDIEGNLTNLLNGTYLGKLALSGADPQEDNWRWRARIRDKGGNDFETDVELQIVGAGSEEVLDIVGTVESLGDSSLVVNSLTISLSAATEILNDQAQLIEFSELGEGDLVAIEAVALGGDVFVARRIVLELRSEDEINLAGQIESLEPDRLVVLATTFFVTGETEVLDSDGNPIPFGQLTVGQVVEVRGRLQQDGTFLALRIKVNGQSSGEIEFVGRINELGDNEIVVDEFSFVVNSETEILDNQNNPLLFSELVVGQRVQIRGIEVEGNLVATRIKVEDGPNNDEIEIVGEVTNVGESTITVGEITFQVTESTEILDQENNPISLENIQNGFTVQVRADVLSDNTFLATRIKIEDSFADELEIVGLIDELSEESLTVAGFEFLVTEGTEVVDDSGNPIEFGDLQVGLLVQIKAVVRVDGSIVALRIKVEDRFRDEVELTGTIEAIDAPFISVAGLTFEVTGETEIFDNDGNPIAFENLQVGQLVEIKGTVRPDGSLVAVRIELEDRIEDEVEVTGVIELITDVSVTVLGRTFGVTGNTAVFDNNENLISLDDLFVGQTVEVRGDLLADGTLVAIRIKLEDRDADEIEVVGPIESSGQNTFQVVGITFFVTDTTEILDTDNNSIQFGELSIGQTVEVRALGQTNGTRVATRVRVQDLLLLSGVVDQVVFNGISVLGKDVLFDANTLILGKLNMFLSVKDLTAGQFVEIRGENGGGNVVFSTKVKVQNEGIVSSVRPVEPDRTLPATFTLGQNYPNPFNPTTTLTFRVPGNSAAVHTKLAIYNLLGQAVRTLVDEPLPAGQTYQAQWDATDDHGIRQASGIYLYRLQAGSFSETRRMILTK